MQEKTEIDSKVGERDNHIIRGGVRYQPTYFGLLPDWGYLLTGIGVAVGVVYAVVCGHKSFILILFIQLHKGIRGWLYSFGSGSLI